ncbi:MAG: ABC transporter ATP-binding protein [Bacteroidia bacterium]
MNTLTIKNLSKVYPNGVCALNNISLELKNGMFGLLGPNGSGKSTLMKTISGLQLPDKGLIYFNEYNIIDNPINIKKHLGYLPQEFGVYPKLSTWELMNHIAILKGMTSKADRKNQIEFLLNKTNLLQHKNKEVHTFSGGMKQRFGIAQALLGNPQLIIVDEPTAGLDPEERYRFNNMLSEIGEKKIVLLSTHIVEDVRNLCSNLAILLNGNIVKMGSTDEMINNTSGIWTKTIESKNFKQYSSKYSILYSSLNAGRQKICIRSNDDPGNGFESKTPELEDVYFLELLQQRSATSL